MHRVYLCKLTAGTPEQGVYDPICVIAEYEDYGTALSLATRLNACGHLTAGGTRHFVG